MTPPPMTMPVMVRFWGPLASFNRPEFQSERVSYQVPTPSAVRGMLESIYWKPEFHWRVREVRVLNRIRWYNETRNEVTRRANRGSPRTPLLIDGQVNARFQRHTACLYDVNYVVVAETVPNAWSVEEMEKHTHIFNERVALGRCYAPPYLGCREFAASFDQATGAEEPFPVTIDLGRMAFDQNFRTAGMSYASHNNDCKPVPVYFDARVERGVLKVPDELYAYSGGCRAGRTQPPLPPWAA